MAGHNRHLRGDINSIKIPCHGNITIEPGDLCVIAGTTPVAPAQCGGKADRYVYPFSAVTGATEAGLGAKLKNWFVGVAMSGSPSGVTNNVTVAQTGVFRYPMATTGGTTIGLTVTGVTPTSNYATTGGSKQYVYGAGSGSSVYLGYTVITQKGGSSYVDFRIKTKYGEGLIS